MVNAFTASTVMQSFTKKYRFQTRSYETAWAALCPAGRTARNLRP